MAADKQYRTHDFARRIHKIERNEIVFRYVPGRDTAGLNFGGSISVFQQVEPIF